MTWALLLEDLDTLIQIAIQIFIIWKMIPVIRMNRQSMTAVFFSFAMVCYLISNLYWITHIVMKEGVRIPFAANEISASGMFLLMAAVLKIVFHEHLANAKKEIIYAALFAAASTGLWIGWSGELIKDILSGFTFGYFLCVVTAALKTCGAFSEKEWRALAISSAVLIAVQTSIFFAPEMLKKPLDAFCYVLMFVWIGYFFCRAIPSALGHEEADRSVVLSVAGFAWTISTMYMSASFMYVAADTCSTCMQLLMYAAIRKKVRDA